jgi:hypothetical protein
MSPSQHEPAEEQPEAPGPARILAGPTRRPPLYPEGIPIPSLSAAALISFVCLATSSWTIYPAISEFLDEGGGLGPFALPTVSGSVLVEALIGTAVLTIISLTILLAQRHHRIADWIPFVASFPAAWALTLPSALEHGGSLPMWFIFGAMVAGIFCVHWGMITWLRRM